MKNKVIPIGTITKLELPVEPVLEAAKEKLSGVLLIGFDKEGELYTASTYNDGGDIIWLLEMCKERLLENLANDDF